MCGLSTCLGKQRRAVLVYGYSSHNETVHLGVEWSGILNVFDARSKAASRMMRFSSFLCLGQENPKLMLRQQQATLLSTQLFQTVVCPLDDHLICLKEQLCAQLKYTHRLYTAATRPSTSL